MREETIVIDTVYIDKDTSRDDEILLIKKIQLLLKNMKEKRERLVVLLCDEPRTILKGK